MSTNYAADELKQSEKVHSSTDRDFGRMELIHSDFLFSTIPGAVLVYKIHGDHHEVITCSRGIVKLVGFEPEEFCACRADSAKCRIHPADEALFAATLEEIVKTESQHDLMFRGYRKDRSIVWLWFQGQYIGQEDGDPLVEALVLDASNNADMYQTVLDQTQSLVTVVDTNSFEVLYANRVAKDVIAKLCPGNYIGSVCYQHVMKVDKPCSFCIVNNTQEDSWVNPKVELYGRCFRQVYRRMKWHGRDTLLEFTTDITEQVENENLINQQRKMNATILDAIPAGIMVFKLVEDKIEIVSANRGICEMAGMNGVKSGWQGRQRNI